MEVKEKHYVLFILAVVIAICGYVWFKRTEPIRKYKAEIKQLKLISEHQDLEIEVALQLKDLAELKEKSSPRNVPQYNLTPKDPNE